MEFGLHATDEGQVEVLENIETGIIDRFGIWPESVATRISEYGPGMITIDSLLALGLEQSEEGGLDLIQLAKDGVWGALPASPRELNGMSSIKVVAGDVVNRAFQEPVHLLPYLIPGTVAASAAGSLFDEAIYHCRRNMRYYDNITGRYKQEQPDDGISRRGFMTYSLGALFLAPGFLQSQLSADSGSAAQEVAVRMADFTEEYSVEVYVDTTKSDVDGRTALLAQKTLDAQRIERRGSEVATVLLGNSHLDGVAEMRRDPDRRAEIIRKYFEDYREVTLNNSSESFFYDEGGRFPASSLVRLFTNAFVMTVQQPTEEMLANPRAGVTDELVSFEYEFVSPGVVAAIEDLLSDEELSGIHDSAILQ